MLKRQYFVRNTELFFSFYKLGKVSRFENKTQNIHTVYFFNAAFRGIEFARVAFYLFLAAIHITRNTEFQFQIVSSGVILFVMIDQHTGILKTPLQQFFIAGNGIVNRSGNGAVNILQHIQLIKKQGGLLGNGNKFFRQMH